MQNDPKILVMGGLSAFGDKTIGTKVIDAEQFMGFASVAIATTDFVDQKVSGQAYITCADLIPFVSAGVGKRTQNPDDYAARVHRGNVELFLKREHAVKADGCAIIVYTREAYLNDPEVIKDLPEFARVTESDCTHVLVAVQAFAGPESTLSPHRFVSNLAGGNNKALIMTADEIRTEATKIKAYHDTWCTVAD
jgi:hypothetical protein